MIEVASETPPKVTVRVCRGRSVVTQHPTKMKPYGLDDRGQMLFGPAPCIHQGGALIEIDAGEAETLKARGIVADPADPDPISSPPY